MQKKLFEEKLSNCPDKHAKLTFTLAGTLREEIAADNISQNSYANSDVDPNMSSAMHKKNGSEKQNVSHAPTSSKS
jgi:hypothetical protein